LLRDYQHETINEARTKAQQGKRRVIIVCPTGSGKTTIAADMIKNMMMNGKSVVFVVHRQELAYQARDRLRDFNVISDIHMAGSIGGKMLVTVASIQTLVRRPLLGKEIVFIDEAHHSVSASYLKVLKPYADAGKYIYGLTATPYRLDRKCLGELYQDVVSVTSIKKLIEAGYLVSARYFGAKEVIDMSQVRTLGGDYNQKEMFDAANKDVLYKNVVENYLKFCPNKERAIVFNVTKEHSRIMADKFTDQGVAAIHLDCDVKSSERMKILEMFAAGVYKVICNVGILTEGYDLPAVHAIILNKATTSRCLYIQMIGRALRPSGYKEHAIIIDHAANVITHRFIEDEDEFEYDIHRVKKPGPPKDAPVKVCPECQAILHAAIIVCPRCGYIFPVREKEEKEGEFKEYVKVDFTKIKTKEPLPEHLQKPYRFMDIHELQEVATIREYKKGWVYFQLRLQEESNGIPL
jgi:superfamily II DNA or RNA helicase